MPLKLGINTWSLLESFIRVKKATTLYNCIESFNSQISNPRKHSFLLNMKSVLVKEYNRN